VRIAALELVDWRNFAHVRLQTDARFVVLHGDNAQGKTNLLEAAWVLATLRSFREARQARLVRHGEDLARIDGVVLGESGRRRLTFERISKGRQIRVDGQRVGALVDWFALLRAVLFCPEHGAIIRGGPVERRTFVDRAAFTMRPAHLDVVREYLRALKHKAALLRGPGPAASVAMVRTWNEQLSVLGARLAVRRSEAMADLSQPFADAYKAIGGPGAGLARLRMTGVGRAAPGERLQQSIVAQALSDRLEAALPEERSQGRCLTGPHRDDLVIDIDGHSARAFASQGQARSLVLALKLAELESSRRHGLSPLFLLDDLTSELDRGRMGRLMDVLADLDNQVWVTTTDPRWLGPLPGGDVCSVHVVGGAVRVGRHAGDDISKTS